MRDEVRRKLLRAEDEGAVLAALGEADRVTPIGTPIPGTVMPASRRAPP